MLSFLLCHQNEEVDCLMSIEQVGAGGNIWTSDKHYTLREMIRRKVRKFNTSATHYHLSLEPQMGGAPLMDQLDEVFDSMVDEMISFRLSPKAGH